ncbi:MAG: four helix bundle protein [Deltaproteobacteria bacterium]|nr:four helix bundle protein [Deltaproteobacteria bacterium]
MEDYIFPFEKLEVWKLSVDFADYVLEVLTTFPENKYFRLIGQMEAAVASVAQNIAEGKGRQYNKEFVQYLYIAEGSLFEVLTLSELFRRRKLFTDKEATNIREQAIVIDRKIRGLIKSLKKRM